MLFRSSFALLPYPELQIMAGSRQIEVSETQGFFTPFAVSYVARFWVMKAGAVIVRFLRFVLLSLSALKMSRWLFDRTELLPVDEETEFRLTGCSIDSVRLVCSPSAA